MFFWGDLGGFISSGCGFVSLMFGWLFMSYYSESHQLLCLWLCVILVSLKFKLKDSEWWWEEMNNLKDYMNNYHLEKDSDQYYQVDSW